MRKIILSLFLLVIGATAFSQESFPINGVRDLRTGVYAFTNATIIQNEKTKILEEKDKDKTLCLIEDSGTKKDQIFYYLLNNVSHMITQANNTR